MNRTKAKQERKPYRYYTCIYTARIIEKEEAKPNKAFIKEGRKLQKKKTEDEARQISKADQIWKTATYSNSIFLCNTLILVYFSFLSLLSLLSHRNQIT